MKKHPLRLFLPLLLLATGLASGCGGGRVGVGVRYYDPGRSDYHVWNDGEGVYYNQWLVETHRDHRDFHKLKRNDQQAYWQWRHDHPDRR